MRRSNLRDRHLIVASMFAAVACAQESVQEFPAPPDSSGGTTSNGGSGPSGGTFGQSGSVGQSGSLGQGGSLPNGGSGGIAGGTGGAPFGGSAGIGGGTGGASGGAAGLGGSSGSSGASGAAGKGGSGGTSGAGGKGGSAGSAGTGAGGKGTGACETSGDWNISFRRGNAGAQIDGEFDLKNLADATTDLTDVTVRYYFTDDNPSAETFIVTSVGHYNTGGYVGGAGTEIMGAVQTLTPEVSGADSYLEISFAQSAGSLDATESIRVSFYTQPAGQTPADDYSYQGSTQSLMVWDRMTAYVNGSLVWGCEP